MGMNRQVGIAAGIGGVLYVAYKLLRRSREATNFKRESFGESDGVTAGLGDHPKLIVLDLDGALLGPDSMLSLHTAAALQRYRDAGGIIVYSSGRAMVSITKGPCKQFTPDFCVASGG